MISLTDYSNFVSKNAKDDKKSIKQPTITIMKSNTTNKYLYPSNSLMVTNKYTSSNRKSSTDRPDLSFTFVKKEISTTMANKIKSLLKSNFIFDEIPDEILDSIIFQDLVHIQVEQDNIIYEQGDLGNYFFILVSGTLELSINNVVVRILNDFSYFGEIALIQKYNRSETVRSITKSELFILEGENYRELSNKISNIKLRERLDFLELVSTFKALTSIEKNNLVSFMTQIQFSAGEFIVREGEEGDKIYIIKKGCVSCIFRGKEVRKLVEKEYFGQNCILMDTKRSLDVKAFTQTIAYEISKNSLQEALGSSYRETILLSNFKEIVSKNPYFNELFAENNRDIIFKSLHFKCYKNNEIVYSKDWKKENEKFVVLIEGNLINENNQDIIVKKGEIYGDLIMRENIKLDYDIKAYTECLLLESKWDPILEKLGLNMHNNMMKITNRVSNLKKIFIFKSLSESKLKTIAEMMTKKKFENGQTIIQEGTLGDEFYLISKGRVKITKNGSLLRELEEGNCFGEIAVITGDIRSASVIAISKKVICYQLTKDELFSILDNDKIRDYLIRKSSLQDTSIKLNELFFMKFLGKGKFGSVNLVHNKKNLYAIKAVSRKAALKQRILCKYFSTERKIMLQLDHPFIIKMVKSLKNSQYCFFLLEFVNGKNLDDYINEERNYRNRHFETKFYVASMLLMIEYLHKKSIAHRDIKPSNLMIDHNGYLKLIDFGTSKIISDFTHTIIGTPHYMPPEVLAGKGYSLSCDFWSIGICMYELFYESLPFGAEAKDILDVYKEILHQ